MKSEQEPGQFSNPTLFQKYGQLGLGILFGAIYGLLIRYVFGLTEVLSSITFLLIFPVVLGLIPLFFTDPLKIKSYRNFIFIPWITVGTLSLLLYVFGFEDVLCLLVLFGPFLVLGTIAALIGKFININNKRKKSGMLALALVPFVLVAFENMVESPSQVFEVVSVISVRATPERVWQEIVEVDSIGKWEYEEGWFNKMGIPRPIHATVDTHGLGGHRVGYFEGGLKFQETITEYQENEKIAFSIQIDSASVRQTVFDQHVLAGNYFEFVDARYEIKKLPNNKVALWLKSRYRLTSKVNFYGRIWGELMLGDFQERLLVVVKGRSEFGF